jgi:Bacterial regulatory protein, Fis family
MAGDRITLSELEREHILSTLRRCRGNRTHAARSLGISVRGLRIKLATYSGMGVEVPSAAEHHGSTCVMADTHLSNKTGPIAGRGSGLPRLDRHVRRQLGFSLRIFYDAVLCGPLPPEFVELATRASDRRQPQRV